MAAPRSRLLRITSTRYGPLLHLRTYQARQLSSLRTSRSSRNSGGPRLASGRPVVNRRPTETTFEDQGISRQIPNYALENPSLLAPIHVPEDKHAALRSDHPAARLLENSALVVSRQLELMNVMLGYEQANKYVISDPQGNRVGYIAEEDNSIAKTISRQLLNTHRAFTTHIFDKHEKEVLRFHRPFAFINSRISVYDPLEPRTFQQTSNKLSDFRTIGEAQQEWHIWRRKYNLFLHHNPPTSIIPTADSSPYVQFAYIDEGFLSWDFSLLTEDNQMVGHVSRNWGGFGREILTDTGTYVLRMDAAGAEEGVKAPAKGMTLDQRAVMLATAVSVDFDYFSRKSGHHGGFMPYGMFGGGAEHNDQAAGGQAGANDEPPLGLGGNKSNNDDDWWSRGSGSDGGRGDGGDGGDGGDLWPFGSD